MTHLPFIAVSYGLTILVMGGFAFAAWRRSNVARDRLAAIDPRRDRGAR